MDPSSGAKWILRIPPEIRKFGNVKPTKYKKNRPQTVGEILTVSPDRGVAAGNVWADRVHDVAAGRPQRLAKEPARVSHSGGDVEMA